MNSDSVCPQCGAENKTTEGAYCPTCYLLVGLEGIDPPDEEFSNEVAEKPGDKVGRFELLEEIGEGGFGVVFRARQDKPVQRTLAVKVIKPGMDSREIVARFEAERQALALMNHPNIAKVYDAGTTALGRPFFAMELVEGLPLTKFCDQNQLPINRRLELFKKICDGVQHAHQKGIVHRDLKPGNILVHADDNGTPCPKIIDFGVAKAIGIELTEQTFFTLFGRLVGTPEYMSPEQAGLNALDIDTRSDIYSLGVVLHELLAGCVPLGRDQLTKQGYNDMRRMILELEPPRASARFTALGKDEQEQIAKQRNSDAQHLARELRNDLDWVVMKAIEKDRTRRYETAQELGQDVGRYLSDLPVYAGPPSKVYRLGKFVQRHRLGVVAASLILLTLIGGIIAQQLSSLEAKNLKEDAEKLKIVAQWEAKEAQIQLRKKLVLSATKNREAQGERWRSEALSDIGNASKIWIGEDLRNEALAILAGSDMEKSDLGFLLNDPQTPVAFSSDHKLVAIGRDRKQIEILHLDTKEPARATISTKLSIENCQLAFGGKDHRYLIIASEVPSSLQIEIFDLETNSAAFPVTEVSHLEFALLSDDQGIALLQSNSVVFLDWNGAPLRDPLLLSGQPISLSLNSKADKLAVGIQSPTGDVRGGRLEIFELSSGKKLPEGRSGFEPWKLSWSPSGTYLAMADNDRALVAFEPGVINSDHPLSGHSTAIQKIVWSPDERLLATTTTSDREIQLWDACHWSQLSSHGALATDFSFSPDGQQLGPVISKGKIYSLRVLKSNVCYHAIGHRGSGRIVASAWDSRVSPKSNNPKNNRYSLAFATAGQDSVIIWGRKGQNFASFNDVTKPAGLAFSESWFYMAGEEGIVRRELSIIPMEPFGPFLDTPFTPCTMHFAEPRRFSDLTHCRQLAVTPDERLLIAASSSGVWLIDTSDGSKTLIQNSHPDPRFDSRAPIGKWFDIDPQGRWLAIGNNNVNPDNTNKVKIYKLPAKGESPVSHPSPAKELDTRGVTTVAFSEELDDNGRVLLATGNSLRYQFWSVNDDWVEQKHLEIPTGEKQTTSRVVFSPRSTALAVSYAHDKLKVLDPRNMEVLIKPGFDSQWPLAISEDGALIGTEDHRGRLFLWDLKAVRDEFEELGIDWPHLTGFVTPIDLHILVTAAPSAGEEGK
jgi:serine/threonine protein kinase/WD40 repeat protein